MEGGQRRKSMFTEFDLLYIQLQFCNRSSNGADMIDLKSLRQTKLYLVWIIMKFDARRTFRRTGNLCIAPEFREFKDFAHWAITKKRYKIGRDDNLQLVRKDIKGLYSPDNCYFCDYSDIIHNNGV